MEFEKIQQIISGVLKVAPDEVTSDARFVEDFGADSLDLFQLIIELENAFSVEIPTEAAQQIITVGDAADWIARAEK